MQECISYLIIAANRSAVAYRWGVNRQRRYPPLKSLVKGNNKPASASSALVKVQPVGRSTLKW
jgi:hypothetical protein